MSLNTQSGTIVFVVNLDRAAAFYRDVMSLAATHADDHVVVLENEHTHLVLHAIPPHIAKTIDIADPPAAREDTAIKPFFFVPDLAAAREAAQARGGRFAPASKEWQARGFRACDGVDPEGNVVQVRAPVR